ncbi:MAG: hypothetical protein WB755_25065 [Terriglobales bacterium]
MSGQEGERLFRILGYGTILLLLGFLLFAFFLEPPTWSEAAGDLLAEIVFVILLISLVALPLLYLVRKIDFFEPPLLSAQSARWVHRASVASLISFFFVLGIAFFYQKIVGIFLWLPFWLPLLLIVLYLRSNTPKKGLALSVAMGLTLFLLFYSLFSIERDWESALWIQGSLVLAALSQLILAGAAIRTYYSLPKEPRDLHKLLWSLAYGFVLFCLLVTTLPFEDKETIHEKMAERRLEDIHTAASEYAQLFGGVFPESLGALGLPPSGQKTNCRAAGLLQRRLETSGGYHIEYHSGPPSTTIAGPCGGAKSYTATARPSVYGKTGSLNLYTDEGGVIRCTCEDRPANASDSSSCGFLRFSPSGPPSEGRSQEKWTKREPPAKTSSPSR